MKTRLFSVFLVEREGFQNFYGGGKAFSSYIEGHVIGLDFCGLFGGVIILWPIFRWVWIFAASFRRGTCPVKKLGGGGSGFTTEGRKIEGPPSPLVFLQLLILAYICCCQTPV